jgi:hypothetical protein
MSNQRTRLNALVDEIRRRRARDYPPILRPQDQEWNDETIADMNEYPGSPQPAAPVPTPIAADPPAGAGEIPALISARALETALDRPLRFVPRSSSEPEAIDRCIQCQVRLVNHFHQGRRLSCQDAVSRFGVS